jgi:hypothetical protein
VHIELEQNKLLEKTFLLGEDFTTDDAILSNIMIQGTSVLKNEIDYAESIPADER